MQPLLLEPELEQEQQCFHSVHTQRAKTKKKNPQLNQAQRAADPQQLLIQ
jgi:hypothetical protein